ncbi:hypothetical protein DOY81_006655, partial [Sarcophaga bullata]
SVSFKTTYGQLQYKEKIIKKNKNIHFYLKIFRFSSKQRKKKKKKKENKTK